MFAQSPAMPTLQLRFPILAGWDKTHSSESVVRTPLMTPTSSGAFSFIAAICHFDIQAFRQARQERVAKGGRTSGILRPEKRTETMGRLVIKIPPKIGKGEIGDYSGWTYEDCTRGRSPRSRYPLPAPKRKVATERKDDDDREPVAD